MADIADYEKLGVFYLGRAIDPATGEVSDEPVLYDAKDLTTHAVCVGMTGSGKTGLGVALLEEAVIDGIPVIAIDPKGDLGNLMLTFPELRPEDFEPWIDSGDAARQGRSVAEQARATSELWRRGLADWGQPPERIARFASAADRCIYTPGSRSGVPLSILGSLSGPPPGTLDEESLRERIAAAASGLLGLLGVDADPLRSREHVLLATLLAHAWGQGQRVDLATLIHQIQKPPMERIGVMPLESFFPEGDRFALAMRLNNLMASPGFEVWTEGEPLDAAHLLYGRDGRPKLSIVSIAHLSEGERMFVVTQLLSQLIAWMRAQPGARTLRALLYMDEVFGYFPPTANPPSKTPMLTLLKQARAYGLGVVLATQNPVDLDYKGLSNAGTWFLGRLQTERDKQRVLDGLEGAAAGASGGFDRAAIERTLSGLSGRHFLMHNVHEDAPVLFHTRWVLSYLAGPMARDQIRRLTAGGAGPAAAASAPRPAALPTPAAPKPAAPARKAPRADRPVVPDGVDERFLPVTRAPAEGERLVYRPALLATGTLHYVKTQADVDQWERVSLLAPLAKGLRASPWKGADRLDAAAPDFESAPEPDAEFAEVPAAALRVRSYASWGKQLKTHLYREYPLPLWSSKKPKLMSRVGEEEGGFRARVRDALREERDLALEKLRARFAPKLVRLQDQVERAELRVDKERQDYSDKKLQTAVSIGATLVGALFGRKLGSVGNVGRATTAVRGASRAARERGDISRAAEKVESLRERLAELEADLQDRIAEIDRPVPSEKIEVRPVRVPPRKTDLEVERLVLLWVPWRVDADGLSEPAGELG